MPVALQTRIVELEDEVGRLNDRIAELDTVHRVKVEKLRKELADAKPTEFSRKMEQSSREGANQIVRELCGEIDGLRTALADARDKAEFWRDSTYQAWTEPAIEKLHGDKTLLPWETP